MSREPYDALDEAETDQLYKEADDANRRAGAMRKYGHNLAEVADELTTEWLRFGGVKPELIKRLQYAIDEWYEGTEDC